MEAIDKASSTAKAWLKDIGDQSRWSKHVFHPTVCCDENKINFIESFNATLRLEKCKPLLTLVEGMYSTNIATRIRILIIVCFNMNSIFDVYRN